MSEEKKFYFAGSIRGGREDAELYREIIHYLQNFGQVLTEHVGLDSLKPSGEKKDEKFIHDRDMAWLDESDAMIAEVTTTSLGVGYEIGRAIEQKKTILCLFRPETGKALSAMIRGAEDGKQVMVKDYKGDEYKKIVKDFLITNNLV